MIEQLAYSYFDQLLSGNMPTVGDVLNVGLGKGFSARFLLDRKPVTSVTTIEWDQSVIDTYEAKFNDALEADHTIIHDNVLTGTFPGTYNLIYVDMLYAPDQANYDTIKNALLNLAPNTASGTWVLIEWASDNVIERELKEWLDTVLTRTMIRNRLSPFGRGRAADMVIWRKP